MTAAETAGKDDSIHGKMLQAGLPLLTQSNLHHVLMAAGVLSPSQ